MSRPALVTLSFVLITLSLLAGCHPTQPFYLHEDGDLSHYLDSATEVAYPDLDQARLEDVTQAEAPLTIADPEFKEFWDLKLEDAVSIALQNSKVIRGGGEPVLDSQGNVIAANDNLIQSGGSPVRFQATIYDPAILETNSNGVSGNLLQVGEVFNPSLTGNIQGVEDALSEFDAKFASSLFWTKSDRVRNFRQSAFFTPQIVSNDATFKAEVSKKSAAGTQFFFRNVTDYNSSNSPNNSVVSLYTTAFEVEARQPILRGRGTMINRIPVILARIETDQEIADVEAQLQNMICNIEVRYWDLHCAYRDLETAKKGRDSALGAWRVVYAQAKGGTETSTNEARAREQYFFFRSAVEQSLSRLYTAESNLRFLLGIASTDGRLIRPIDEPSQARVEFDWHAVHCEALFRRPLVRRQRWQIKQQELELAYSKNALLPEFNAIGLYRWLGSGDDLAKTSGAGVPPSPRPGSDALVDLFGGQYQEAFFGFEFNMPIGFRRELARVRNAQLRLAREHAYLDDLELDVSRELTQAVRALETQYQLAQTHYNRWTAAEKEVEGFEAREEYKDITVDLLLDSQRRRADAQIAYYRALCEYNKLLALIHRRKGSMLDYTGIVFAEGPWAKKAYWDALGHARRRDAAKFMNYGWTRPNVVSKGALPSGRHYDAVQYEPSEVTSPLEEIIPVQPTMRNSESVLQDAPAPTASSFRLHSKPNAIGSGLGASNSGPELIPATGKLIRVPGKSVLQ